MVGGRDRKYWAWRLLRRRGNGMDVYGDGRIGGYARRAIGVEKAAGGIRRSFLRCLRLRPGRRGKIDSIPVGEMRESERWRAVLMLLNAVGRKGFVEQRRRRLLLILTSRSGQVMIIPSRSSRPTRRNTAN